MNRSLRLYALEPTRGAELLRSAPAVHELVTGDDPRLAIGDIWPALHVLLTSGDPPMPRDVAIARGVAWKDTDLENVLMGGEATPYDDGLSHARFLAPAWVKAFAPRIPFQVEDAQVDTYLMDFAPRGWDRARVLDELRRELPRLRVWYLRAADAGKGMLICGSPIAVERMTLRRIGYFRETKQGRPADPSLADARRSAADPDEAKLVAYLQAGVVMAAAGGPVRDVLTDKIIGPLTIRTDGMYAWPSDLAHYVATYHVEVPAELLAHARESRFAIPAGIQPGELDLG